MAGRSRSGFPDLRVTIRACALPLAVMLGASCGVAHSDPLAIRSLLPPVPGPIVRGFTQTHAYGPGHTGIDFAVPYGTPVRAAGPGTVGFSGVVAGNLTISVDHGSAVVTSYSFLSHSFVSAGARVDRGAILGISGSGHPGEVPALHFSLRQRGVYVDPAPYLRLGAGLLPPPDLPEGFWSAEGDGGGDTSRTDDLETVAAGTQGRGDAGSSPSPERGRFICLIVTGRCPVAVRGELPFADRVAEAAAKFGADLLQGVVPRIEWAAKAAEVVSRRTMARVEHYRNRAATAVGWAAGLPVLLGAAAASLVEPVDSELASEIRERAESLGASARDRARERAAWLIGLATRRATDHIRRIGSEASRIQRLVDFERQRRNCVDRSPDRPPLRRAYVLVGGYSSSMEVGALPFGLDLDRLGVSRSDVFSFSYRGHDITVRPPVSLPYTAEATYRDIRDSAKRLGELVEAVAASRPGDEIVIIGHSQGGIVSRYYLSQIRPPSGPPPVARFVSLGSPHRGSLAAEKVLKIRETRTGRAVTSSGGKIAGSDTGAISLTQLAPESALFGEMGTSAPKGVATTSIAAAEDVVVPSPQSFLDGADNVLVRTGLSATGAHSAMLAHEGFVDAVAHSLDGKVPCKDLGEWIADDARGRFAEALTGSLGDGARVLAAPL